MHFLFDQHQSRHAFPEVSMLYHHYQIEIIDLMLNLVVQWTNNNSFYLYANYVHNFHEHADT